VFEFFAHIDRTFRSDSKSLIFINTGYPVKLWEASKVRQSAIADSRHCDVMNGVQEPECRSRLRPES